MPSKLSAASVEVVAPAISSQSAATGSQYCHLYDNVAPSDTVASTLVTTCGLPSPGHIVRSPGRVTSPPVKTCGTVTVKEAVSEQPFAFSTVTVTTVVVVIPVVINCSLA